jgi:hypothetical protein
MRQIIINNYKNFIFLIIILILIIINRNLKTQTIVSKQNIEALQDKVRIDKTKNGKKEFIIKSLVVKNKRELKKLSEDLYREFKNEKGKVLTISKINTVIEYDTLLVKSEFVKYPDGYNEIKWLYDTIYSKNNFKKIIGVSKFRFDENGDVCDLETFITENLEGIEIILGYKDSGNGIELFARSDHPYFKVNDIQSVLITSNSKIFNKYSKGKRLFLGPYIGVGVDKNLIIRPNIGFAIGYNLNK